MLELYVYKRSFMLVKPGDGFNFQQFTDINEWFNYKLYPQLTVGKILIHYRN